MRFNSVTIKNFRNFEDISINLTNKNVLFGMNDVGKTNFLYALRYVFDKDIRKQNFSDTDYFKKNVESPIEIVVAIDISDVENADSQKLRAKLKGALGNVLQPCTARLPISCVSSRIRLGLCAPITPLR